MQSINLLIAPITGYTATERAEAISRELWAITRPPQVREPQDTVYLFAWKTHPTTGECVLIADADYVIPVHPENDLTALLALFPTLSSQEKASLALYIENSQTFLFGAILPSNSTILTNEQLTEGGWF